MRISPERFRDGITIRQFFERMEKNRETFQANYEGFVLDAADAAFLRELTAPLNVLVLAEDWCGDVARYLPVFARMAEAAQGWDVRVFYRDRNLDIADHCLKEGKYRAIPVLLFFDKEMNELACFTERPASVYTAEASASEQFAAEHPDLPDAALPPTQMNQDTYTLYVSFIRQYRANRNRQWQQLFVEEIKAKLQRITEGALSIPNQSGS